MPTTPESDRHLFLVFSTFKGHPARFAAWYDEEHTPQLLSAPGVQSAQRFEIADTKPLPGSKALEWGHLALYELGGDPQPFREHVAGRVGSGEMALPDFVEQPLRALLQKPVSPAYEGALFDSENDLADRHLFFAWSAHHGDYDTYAHWYDVDHVPQVMSAPGMFRAQRFMSAGLEPLPGTEDPDMYHLALYELLGDMADFREGVKQMLMSGEMVIPDFMIPPFETLFMRPVSRRFTAETVAA
jgi:hypothetical protein